MASSKFPPFSAGEQVRPTETTQQADPAPDTSRLLETTIAHIDQGIAIFDAETRLTFCNPQYGQLLGFPPGFLAPGRTMMVDLVRALVARGDFMFAGRDPDAVLAGALAGLERNEAERIVQRLYNGRSVQSNRKRIPGGYAFTLTDISATRAAEAKLADTHRMLDAIIANVDQGFAVYDRNLLLTFCNPQYVALTGAPIGFVVPGRTRLIDVLRFLVARGDFPGRSAEDILADTIAAVRTPGAVRMERRDTNGRCFEINRKLMRDGGLVITITDVTDARTAEAALAQAHRLQEATLASMDQGFAAYGADGVLLACNERHRELLAVAPEQLRIGVTTITDVVRMLAQRGEYGPGDTEALARARVEQITGGVPTRYQRPLTPGTWVQMNSNPLAGGGTVVTLTDITPLKQAEQAAAALRDEATRARRQLNDAIEAISEGFVLWDAQDRLVMFNARYRDQYSFAPDKLRPGVTYEEIIRESVRRGMVPVGYDAEQWVRERLDLHRNPRDAYVVQRRDGRWTMITEYDTQDGGVVGIRTDVTRLRASEEAAKAAQRRLMEAIDAVPQGFVIYDADDRIAVFNSRYREHFTLVPDVVRTGLSFEDLSRETLRRGLVKPAPADPGQWLQAHVAAHRAGTRKFVAHRGSRWIAVDEARTASGDIVVIHTDITDLKQQERELRRGQRLLRGVIDAVPAVINVKDRHSRYVLMNRFQGEVYGVAPEEAIGKTSADFVGARYGGESSAMDEQVIRSGTALPWIERDFIDVKCRPHTWFTAKLPLRGEHGRIESVVTVALDITRLKMTERARTNLSRYVAPNLVEDLAAATEPFGPPRSQEIAVLFVDIVGSTAMIAREPIDSVFEFLRAFNGQLARTVFDHAGTLDKFTGDGIMATFGTATPTDRDAANAIACARAIAGGLGDWNRARHAAGMTPVKVGIGVHWGEALMGTVGDEQRLEFAVIGDTVNVAHRLESLSRDLRADIAASEAVILKTREQGGPVDGFVPRGMQALRGRVEPIAVWSLTRASPE